ncbi:MAG: hypothetical protein AAF349_00295 [Cyanobacteria bacterium P01_A01_bin.68]
MTINHVSIEDLFGEGSYQDENYLFINKLSLPISSNINNSAESLFAAIILKASFQFVGTLTGPSDEYLTDENNNQITYDNRNLFDLIALRYYSQYRPVGIIRDVFEYLNFIPYD